MKIKDIIIGLLVITVGILLADEFCIITIIDSDCKCEDSSSVKHCVIDSNRYKSSNPTTEGGEIITVSEGAHYIADFWNNYATLPNLNCQGVFISKKTFDQIFDNNLRANGITFYFAREGDKLNLVLDPSAANAYEIGGHGTPDAIYYGQAWCPTHCGFNDQELHYTPPPPPTEPIPVP